MDWRRRTAAPTPDDELLADRYRLLEPVGRGRSTVYRAEDTRLRRLVAVKQVQIFAWQDDHDQVRRRTRREAHAAARVNNPHAVTVFDVIEDTGSIWLVMELVPSPSLAQVVTDGGPLAESRAARIGLGVLAALEAAHATGVVHRDVKPANVLVVDDDHAKLADFGVATIRDETRVTATGLVVGSPAYMAPEQARGERAGPAADLWALGATLYYSVEGAPPFEGGSALAVASAVVHDEPRPTQRSQQLAPLLGRLLHKDPAMRPSADEVRRALTDAAKTPSAAPRPPGGGAPAADLARNEPRTADTWPAPIGAPDAAAAPSASGPAEDDPDDVDASAETTRSGSAGPAGSGPAESAGHAPLPDLRPSGHAADPEGETEVDPARAALAPTGASLTSETEAGPASAPRDTIPAPPQLGSSPDRGAPPLQPPSPPPPALSRRQGQPVPRLRVPVGLLLVLLVTAVVLWTTRADDDDPTDQSSAGQETPDEADSGSTVPETAPEASQPSASTTAPPPPATESGQPVVPAGWTLYENPDAGYAIAYPPGWQVVQPGGPRIDFRDPQTGSYLRVDWTSEPRSDPVADWQAQAGGFANRHEGYEEIQIAPFAYRDYNAALWEFRYFDGGVQLHVANLGFVTGGRGYALYFQTHEDRWSESQALRDQFRQAYQPAPPAG